MRGDSCLNMSNEYKQVCLREAMSHAHCVWWHWVHGDDRGRGCRPPTPAGLPRDSLSRLGSWEKLLRVPLEVDQRLKLTGQSKGGVQRAGALDSSKEERIQQGKKSYSA